MLDRRLLHAVAVARATSFSGAAEKFGITQSGITRSIADLERELGYALFYRTGRGVTLTERGRDFVERAEQLVDGARALFVTGGDDHDAYARSLRIGVAPPSLEWRLADPLAVLLVKRPSLRFEVLGSGVERCVHQLRSGAVDVAFGFEEAFADWSDIKLTPVGSISAILYVRKGHPVLKRSSVSRAELAGLNCVMPSDSRPFGTILRNLFEDEGAAWPRHLHVTAHQMAASDGFREHFERVPIEGLFQPFPVCCATRARWELSLPVKAFLQVMMAVTAGGYEF